MPATKAPVSVIVPVYNGMDVLADQLSALGAQDFSGLWECIVADNGSTDGSAQVALRFKSSLPLRIIDASSRRGNAAARNQGAASAEGDVLVFADQDDLVSPTWLTGHVAALERGDLSVGPFEMAIDVTRSDRKRVSMPRIGYFRFLRYGLSSNMAVRRGVFEQLGGFLEHYPAACDVDLCWRAQLAGFGLVGADSSVVVKRQRVSPVAAFRQHYGFGLDDARLYDAFASAGMQRQWDLVVRSYGWLAVTSPTLLMPRFRRRWLSVAGQRWGRVVGSLQTKRLYL